MALSAPRLHPAKASLSQKTLNDYGRSWWVLNWGLGHCELMRVPTPFIADDEGGDNNGGEAVRSTVMGEHAEEWQYAKKFAGARRSHGCLKYRQRTRTGRV